MPRRADSPFQEGFRALFREPGLLPAELMWRWCFGAAATVLVVAFIGLFLDSLTVTVGDQFLLGSLQPILWQSALQHIFHGSLGRFLLGQCILFAGIVWLWALAASFGRAAILSRLVEMFRADGEPLRTPSFSSILGLNLLRAAWSIIALSVAIGSLAMGLIAWQANRAGNLAVVGFHHLKFGQPFFQFFRRQAVGGPQ